MHGEPLKLQRGARNTPPPGWVIGKFLNLQIQNLRRLSSDIYPFVVVFVNIVIQHIYEYVVFLNETDSREHAYVCI